MSPRPIPPHGTYARANGSPGYRKACKCQPCLVARRRHDKRWKVNRDLGKPASVDAAPARKHLALLRETHTWRSLATATGLAESNLYYIANGARATIHRDTHHSILAVQPKTTAVDNLHIDALGSRRRLQALMTIGHSVRSIARECRIAKDRAHDIALGLQPTVRSDVAERIKAAYMRLAFRPAPANKHTNRTRNLAASRGFHGPLAWEDIDDPECQPETDTAVTPRRFKAVVDPDRVARLTLLGRTNEQIAAELGCHERTVSRVRRRAEMQQAA